MDLKKLTTEELKDYLREYHRRKWPEESDAHLEVVMELAEEIHRGQKRPDGPYINHVLRVAVNYTKMHKNEVEINRFHIYGLILHDSVEDQALRLAEKTMHTKLLQTSGVRAQALFTVRSWFGNNTEHMVCSLTNPVFHASMSEEAEHELYVKHVRIILQGDPVCARGKLADFSDNGLYLEKDPYLTPEKRLKYCRRYAPLYDLFIDAIEQKNIIDISLGYNANILTALKQARDFAQSALVAN